jgi:carboxypeptidase family protein/TonB-dependent receptor-like protein
MWLVIQAGLIYGQTTNGTITGIVTDPTDAIVAGAKVVGINQDTGLHMQAQTTVAGVYTISLPPGRYDFTIERAGFKTAVRGGVEVSVTQTTRLDMRLEVGSLSERVTVTAEAPLLQSDSSETGMVVTPKAVLDFPLSTPGQRRMADTFTLLIPGVNTGTGGGGGSAFLAWNMGGQWTVNGSQRDSKEVLYDGISMGKQHSEGRLWAESPPPDAIQEFKMLTGSYSAEFGRSGGGIVNLTMRSGTNDFHGDVYDFLRNDALHARGFFAPAKVKDRQNEFGITAGGPVVIPKLYNGRNRTFIFAFYNGLRWSTASANALYTVPLPTFLAGDFSQWKNADGSVRLIYDPLTNAPDGKGGVTRTQFPGSVIPASRISPISARIAALLPAPTFNRQSNNFVGVNTTISDDNRGQFKFDHIINDNQRISVLYERGIFVRDGAGPLPARYLSGFTTRNEPATVARFSYDYTVTPRIVNHFSAGLNRDFEGIGTTSIGQGWDAKLGITGVGNVNAAFPFINFGSAVDYGPSLGGEAHALQGEQSIIFTDTVSWVKGKHSLRFGVDFRKYQYNGNVLNREQGSFTFGTAETSLPDSANRTLTGNSTASFLLGAVDSGTSLFATTTLGYRAPFTALFIQDDYKVTRRLTLNLGLRYEIPWAMHEVANRLSLFDPTLPNPGAGGHLGALSFAGNCGACEGWTHIANTDYKEFGPRAGFAMQLFRNTVIRGGYGIFYAAAGASTESGVGTGLILGYNAQPTPSSTDTGITPAFYWDNGFSQDFQHPPIINPSFANGTSISNYVRPDDGRAPYIQNWHFGIQQQIKANFLIDVSYVGSKGTRLASSHLRPNQLPASYLALGSVLTQSVTSAAAISAGITPPYAGFTGSVNQALRAFPQYLTVTDPLETLGMSTYNSLQVLLQKRYSVGLHFTVAYTWSKKIDDGSADQVNSGNPGPMDAYNVRLEKALSVDDSPHILSIGYSYELPFGAGKSFLTRGIAQKILGNWQLAGMNRYQSGFPLAISGGNSLPIFSGNRPTYVYGQPIRTSVSPGDFDPARDLYLNAAAFNNGPLYGFGNLSRTTNARGFPLFDESAALIKKFPIRERVTVEFRAEFYNIFNRVVFSSPTTAITSPSFGVVSAQANNPRQGQMALKLNW